MNTDLNDRVLWGVRDSGTREVDNTRDERRRAVRQLGKYARSVEELSEWRSMFGLTDEFLNGGVQ